MYRGYRQFILLLTLGISITANAAESSQCFAVKRMNPDELRMHMVQVSLTRYLASGGACPCPYSLNIYGRSCGADSAYTRNYGKNPHCYTHDISVVDMNKFKASICAE